MDSVYVYVVPLPDGVKEMVLPCADGYTVYVSEKLDEQSRRKSLAHAIRHIYYGDFDKDDVQSIEADAHREIL